MYNGNGRPLSKKKQVQIMIALTILAWATQTLHRQWGFGAEIHPGEPTANIASRFDVAAPSNTQTGDADDAVAPAGNEKFVPGAARFANGATLEMRAEASIIGGEIKLKQVCRWSDNDKAVFAPLADYVIQRVKPGSPFKSISIADVKSVLQDAGVNMATIDFVGATSCTVARSDVAYDQNAALEDWINAKKGKQNEPATQPAPSVAVVAPPTAIPAAAKEEKQYNTLRDLLAADLAVRTHLDADSLQMTFRPEDEKVLNLSEPTFRFELDPIRAENLGEVAWTVKILADGGSQKMTVKANARAWQKQLVLAHSLASRQVIRDEDFVERRVLADTLPFEPLLTKDQAAGQQASSELKPGTVLTARMVEAVPMVRAGQFVSISLREGNVEIKTVARATEAGCYGQTIRFRNETTRDVFEATVTGPQAASMDGSLSVSKVAAANP